MGRKRWRERSRRQQATIVAAVFVQALLSAAWVGAALSCDRHLEVVRFDCTDPATCAGTERMFLLRPPQLFRCCSRSCLPENRA
jgi:hypothetical protein